MWIDDNGVVHTVYVPAEFVLGPDAVAALREVPEDVAEATVAELDSQYDAIMEAVTPEAPTGPSDLDEVDPDDLPYPPVFPGLAPRPGESLADTVLAFLDGVPAQWRLEALEAVVDVLEPIDPDDFEDPDDLVAPPDVD